MTAQRSWPGTLAIFAVAYAFALRRLPAEGRRPWLVTQAGGALFPFVFALYLAGRSDPDEAPSFNFDQGYDEYHYLGPPGSRACRSARGWAWARPAAPPRCSQCG